MHRGKLDDFEAIAVDLFKLAGKYGVDDLMVGF
jgi:hypothetical protein